ncbi:MAG: type II secretion system protein GspM [Pseudomonadota bacterium]
MRAYFDSLSDRERLLVASAAVLLAVLLLLVGVINPIFSYRDNAQRRYENAERMSALIANAAPQASQATGSLRTLVTQRARANDLVIARIADGDDTVDLVFSDVPYTDFFTWLLAVTEEDGLTVAEALVRPGTASGTVNVRMTLAR